MLATVYDKANVDTICIFQTCIPEGVSDNIGQQISIDFNYSNDMRSMNTSNLRPKILDIICLQELNNYSASPEIQHIKAN